MDDQKIIAAGALTIAVILLLFFFFPIFIIIFPVVVAVLFFLFRLPQCKQENANPFFDGWRFGGHRGSPYSFPENSFSGFVQLSNNSAQKEGADLIEFDLALTNEGIAVLMHDDDLDRTTNLNGPVKAKTLKELQKANLAVKFTRHSTSPVNGPVPSDSVPTLESVVQWSVKNRIRMLFDVKDYSDQMVGIIVDLFAKYDLYDKAIVCSFFPWVVYKVKKASPNILTGLTWRQNFIAYSDLDKQVPRYTSVKQFAAEVLDWVYLRILHFQLPEFLGADLLLTNEKDISRSYVDDCRARNIRVAVWTVNDIIQAHWMIDSLKIPILTDFPYLSVQLGALDKFQKNGYRH